MHWMKKSPDISSNFIYSHFQNRFFGLQKIFNINTIFMKIFKSFVHAWQGIRHSYKTQLNFRIHLLVLSVVVIAGYILQINLVEWLFITICSMLVLSLELMNTAIEFLCDAVTKEIHPIIKIVKDVSAAAVFLAAAGSVVIGIIIFLPKILTLIKL